MLKSDHCAVKHQRSTPYYCIYNLGHKYLTMFRLHMTNTLMHVSNPNLFHPLPSHLHQCCRHGLRNENNNVFGEKGGLEKGFISEKW